MHTNPNTIPHHKKPPSQSFRAQRDDFSLQIDEYILILS
jgi:hypothetical protein